MQRRSDPRRQPKPEDDYGAYLDSVLVGGKERRSVVIVDYDPPWPVRFATEAARIREALGEAAHSIDHIGSTSVPGLGAKPIVDICLIVDDPDDESGYRSAIEGLGYELRVDEPGHRAFRTAARDVNLHVYGLGSEERDKYLLLRDWLRRSPQDRRAYEELKRHLATREWDDINLYAEAKGQLISEMLARAAAQPT